MERLISRVDIGIVFLYTLVGHKIEKESKDSVNEEVTALVTTYSSVH